MIKPEIVGVIAATDEAGGLGKQGRIPWRNSTDLKMFKTTTQNSVVIMGRTTYEEIDAYSKNRFDPLLPNRISIVVSSTLAHDDIHNAHVSPTVHDAYNLAVYLATEKMKGYNIFFIGGKRIFQESTPYINKIYLNTIQGRFDCDVTFPFEIIQGFTPIKNYSLGDVACAEFEK